MEERGVNVDHATLNRWVIRYAPTIAAKAHSQKRNTNRSWRMDETDIKVKGKSGSIYTQPLIVKVIRLISLSERRDEDAATAFFKQAINNNGFPDKVVMDKKVAQTMQA